MTPKQIETLTTIKAAHTVNTEINTSEGTLLFSDVKELVEGMEADFKRELEIALCGLEEAIALTTLGFEEWCSQNGNGRIEACRQILETSRTKLEE